MCHRPLYFLGLLLSWGVCGTHRRRAGSSAGWYYQMCGGSDSVKSFTSQADMVKAGWVFSWDDSSLWDASGTYPSAYRGSSSSGDGAVSIQLAGSGVVAVTYGSDSTGTVSVKMNDQVKGTASANTVSQTVELSFNTGDVLAIQESSSIILLQSIDFICDVTSANVPVWAYPETVSATLPYDMGVQSSLNLNSNSYTLMMWLKQGASEPDDSIIIGQHIDTSTTTTSTSITVTATTVTVSTSTTTQSTTTQLCSWDEIPGVYSPGFASGLEEVFDLYGAKEKCKSLGSSSCKAVTCRGEGVTCTVRSSADLFGSAYGENSYVPSSLCYLGGYRNTVTNINSGVGPAVRGCRLVFGSRGTVAMGEEFGWMHLLSVTLFVTGAILTADPEEVVASTGSTLFGSGLALSSGICSGGSALFGRKLKEVNPSIVSTSTLLHMWIFSWMLHFIEGVPSGSFQSMESARPQSVANMLAGFCLDYFLRGHAKLVTILGALLIFAAVLTMLRAQLGSHAKAAAAPKGDYAKETSNLLPLEHIANNP
ncbi:unnamed protein product [Effrenium voratum]|nr:unnamed protein product [Effrenium voratum]